MNKTIGRISERTTSLLYSFISNPEEGSEEERKRIVLSLFLLVSMPTLFGFCIFHFASGNLTRSLVLFLVGLVLTACLISLRYFKKGYIVFRVCSAVLGFYFLSTMIIGGAHGSRIFWMLIFPLLAFFLLGKREGLLWCGAAFLLSLIVFVDPNSIFGTYPYKAAIKARFLITYAIMALVAYIVESARQKFQEGMEAESIKLQSEVEERKRAEEELEKHRDRLEDLVEERTSRLHTMNEKLKQEIEEHTRAEEELRSSERRLADIINFLPDATFVIDTEGKVIAWNRAIEELTGVKAKDMVGKGNYEYAIPFYEVRRPILADLTLNWDEEIAKTYEYVRKDGETLISETPNPPFRPEPSLFWNSARRLYDANGDVIGAIEVIRDITDRMLAEQALREAYDIITKSPAAAFLWKNSEGWPVEFVSDNVESLFGYTAEELISGEVPYSETVHPDDLDRVAKEVSGYSAEEGRKTFTHEPYRIVTKSGVVKWVDDRTYIRRDESGTITHYQGIVEDITERMQIEQALMESEEKYRSILDNISDFIFSHDFEGRFLTVNLAATQTLGYTPDELIGKPINDFMLPEYRQAFKDEYLVQVRKQGFFNGVSIFLAKNGKSHYMEYRATVVKREGEDPYVSGVGRNITQNIEAMREVKKLEKQFQNAQKMEAIATLAGGIAHDFNNLLMGIEGNAALVLLHVDTSHPHYEKLKNIEKYVENGADLTKQLLGFARGGKYEVKPTDPNNLVKKSSGMFGRTKKEISIHPKYQKGIWTVEVDQGQIEQVLLNLYVNAWQAMPGGGELYLQTENVTFDEGFSKPFVIEAGKYVKISVTDTGVGMDDATQERIFEPFFTTKEMGRGTGLGLASVYGIIKNHGGIINVYSEKGVGTTFNIYLPASEKEVMEDKIPSEELLKGTETVLLVDDEEMITVAGGQLLEEIGYRVLIARSGKEAIDIYEKNRDQIDLVILDMIMPVMGGGETYDRLKESNPDIKVLLSSGYSVNGEATEILGRGCNGFIQKPFKVKELSRRMREILDNK